MIIIVQLDSNKAYFSYSAPRLTNYLPNWLDFDIHDGLKSRFLELFRADYAIEILSASAHGERHALRFSVAKNIQVFTNYEL